MLYLAKRNMDVLSVYQFDGEDELKAKIWAEVLGEDLDIVKKILKVERCLDIG